MHSERKRINCALFAEKIMGNILAESEYLRMLQRILLSYHSRCIEQSFLILIECFLFGSV
jgi:hypothetical protein